MPFAPRPGEFRGKTVEAAVASGLAEMGLRRDEADIEVINPGSRGVLGIGAEDALVRLSPVSKPAPSAPRQAPAPVAPVNPEVGQAPLAPRPQPAARAEGSTRREGGERPSRTRRPAPNPSETSPGGDHEPASEPADPELAALSGQMLTEMLHHMGIEASVKAHPGQNAEDETGTPPLVLDIVGEDLAILIGRRGETLAALQYLTRLMVNHRTKRWVNIIVDVEEYKIRRERVLAQMAERMAERVVQSGRMMALEPMPARERRIVHLTLRNHPHVKTESVGEGERRKVTILPK